MNKIVTNWIEKKTLSSTEELVLLRHSVKNFLSELKDDIAKDTDKMRLYQKIDGFME